MTALEQLRALYFNVTRASISEDFGRAIDLFKQLTTEDDREKAAVFMEGIAEMRREWGVDSGGGPRSRGVKSVGPGTGGPSAPRPKAGAPKTPRPKPR
jgi:hypothetical protein